MEAYCSAIEEGADFVEVCLMMRGWDGTLMMMMGHYDTWLMSIPAFQRPHA